MKKHIEDFLESYVKKITAISADVDAIILFGSQARDTAKLSSDVDIAIISSKTLADVRGALREIAEDINDSITVNLFFSSYENLENPSDYFDTNYHIKREGVVLWQR